MVLIMFKSWIKLRTSSLPDNKDEVADGIGGGLEEVPAAASISPMLLAKAVASGSGSLSSDLSLSLPLPAPRIMRNGMIICCHYHLT